jgi:hypothetical protein
MPCLCQRNHVHVAFDHHQRAVLSAGAAGAGVVVKHVALVEELCLVGIEVLGRRCRRQRPAAKGDDPLARRQDRKHDAVAEPVIGNGDLGTMHDQPAGFDLLLVDAARGQVLLQRTAAVRAVTETEGS